MVVSGFAQVMSELVDRLASVAISPVSSSASTHPHGGAVDGRRPPAPAELWTSLVGSLQAWPIIGSDLLEVSQRLSRTAAPGYR